MPHILNPCTASRCAQNPDLSPGSLQTLAMSRSCVRKTLEAVASLMVYKVIGILKPLKSPTIKKSISFVYTVFHKP